MRFSAELVQMVPFPNLLDDFRFAESIGLDGAWVADQFVVSPRAPDTMLLEAWTTLAAIAAGTSKIRIGTLVTNAAMRNPAWLAKQALTVDHISKGRLDVGIGAGYYPEEVAYMGIDWLDGKGRTKRLAEVAAILDVGLRGEHVTFDGEYFQLQDAPMQPAPVQQPRPPLYVAGKAKASLEAAARHADCWVLVGDHGQDLESALGGFKETTARLEEICVAVGRDPAWLRRAYIAGFADEPVFSSVEALADFVGRYQEAGADELCFYASSPGDEMGESMAKSGRAADREMLARAAQDVFAKYD